MTAEPDFNEIVKLRDTERTRQLKINGWIGLVVARGEESNGNPYFLVTCGNEDFGVSADDVQRTGVTLPDPAPPPVESIRVSPHGEQLGESGELVGVGWIDFPEEIARPGGAPWFVRSTDQEMLRRHFVELRASVVSVPGSDLEEHSDLWDRIRRQVPLSEGNILPQDIDMVGQEIRETWPFPMLILVEDFDLMIARDSHLSSWVLVTLERLAYSLVSFYTPHLEIAYLGDW